MSWNFASASLIGPYHTRNGDPNQDSFGFYDFNGTAIIAVADGAGSLKDSQEGSFLAVKTAIEAFMKLDQTLPLDVLTRASVTAARQALLEHPKKETIGCTLAFIAANSNEWASTVVGDAFAVVSHEEGSHTLITQDQDKEYANITAFLTSDTYEPCTASATEVVAGISASSDGLLHGTVKDGVPHDGFWDAVINHNRSGTLDLDSLFQNMSERALLDDDTTLVVGTLV